MAQRLVLRIGMIFITAIVAFMMNSLYWAGYMRYIDTRRWTLFFDLVTNFELVILTIADDLIMMVYLWVATLLMGLVDVGLTTLAQCSGARVHCPIPICRHSTSSPERSHRLLVRRNGDQ